MADLTTKQKKDWAKTLYMLEHVTQKEIALRVGVTEKTMSKWVNDENWEKHKSSIIVTKGEELSRIYMQIKELNDFIFQRPEGERFANSKEADTLNKLSATARQLETDASLPETIEVFKEFLIFIKKDDFVQAQTVGKLCDEYIKHKLR